MAAAPLDERTLHGILMAVPTALLVVSAEEVVVLANAACERLLGYGEGELAQKPLSALIPEAQRASHASDVRGYLAAPIARAMGRGRELAALRKDGSAIPVEIGLATAPGSSVVIASLVDVRHLRQAALVEQHLASIIESSEDAIWSKTLAGEITSWNRGAVELLGYSPEEAIGSSVFRLVPERLHDEERRMLALIREGRRIPPLESVRVRKDGTEISASVSISPILDRQGRVLGASTIVRDIQELQRRDAELKRSNEALQQFAYVASHDLQEPLRMVANYTELLGQRYRGKLDEKADKYIFFASDGARRMQRLISDLLAYSRIDAAPLELSPIALEPLVDTVLLSLRERVRESGAVVSRGSLPVVRGHEGQLRQVFQNLIGNALKFRAEAPPSIIIGAVAEGELVRVSVTDNGIGIDPRFAGQLFQMFKRLNARDAYEGSGIGLAICKRIVERHGGTIGVHSDGKGFGSTFSFTLKPAWGEGE